MYLIQYTRNVAGLVVTVIVSRQLTANNARYMPKTCAAEGAYDRALTKAAYLILYQYVL